MLFSVEQAFVGREEILAPLKTPASEATGSPTNNGFLDTEEGLYSRNVCFLKTFDTFWLFNGILSYPQPVNQLDEMY